MTTTMPEGLDQRRTSIQRAHEASVTARLARRRAVEADRMAGALADRRAAADGLVRHTAGRLRAVRAGLPLALLLVLRGRLRAERSARAQAHAAAVADLASVVAKVRGYQQEAAEQRRVMEAAAVQAAALPRLLDDAALLVRAAGGRTAERLAESEAAITPILARDAVLTDTLRSGRAVQDGVRRALVTGSATDLAGQWTAALRLVGQVPGAAPTLGAARLVLQQLAADCERLEAERVVVRHDLASARAVRTALLRGAF